MAGNIFFTKGDFVWHTDCLWYDKDDKEEFGLLIYDLGVQGQVQIYLKYVGMSCKWNLSYIL